MSLQIGIFDERDVQSIRRAFAAHAMGAMMQACVSKVGKDTVPRMLSKAERTLLAVQSFLIAEEMIDAEALGLPELEEMLKEASQKKKEA
jgi:hypothetical protein